MITLITGLPGNGKTLYAITWLKAQAEKDGRQVYFSGITDCKVPGWIECEAEKWMDLPPNSVILIDEVQRVMRPRQHGSTVPAFVSALETHRHKGVDLVLITQHPMLLDSNVRRLVGQHFHCVRKFGSHFSTIHEWGAAKENCDKNRDDSIAHQWKFPKESFALYKSAEAHTHKRRIPLKVWVLLAMPLLVGAIAYYTWFYRLAPGAQKSEVKNAFTGQVLQNGGAAQKPGSTLTADQYVAQFVPRVVGLAYTAPVYDQITTPTRAPIPAACLMGVRTSGEIRCSCYSQQATKLDVPMALCVRLATDGFFQGWDEQKSSSSTQKEERSGPVSAARAAPSFALPAPRKSL